MHSDIPMVGVFFREGGASPEYEAARAALTKAEKDFADILARFEAMRNEVMRAD